MPDALDEFQWLDATAQAELVRRGDVTPLELVEAAVARIETLNPSCNAVITPRFDGARAAAADPPTGAPFPGVPFLLKDCVAQSAGDPYHCGMRVLRNAGWTSDHDTELVRRFRAAGFAILGKTNLPELATSATTEPLAYGPTHNPWNPDHSPGGSSGGSGAAVAAGMVAVAHGNDMGGSIRIPSSACGLVGLKPTRARSSLGPDFGEYWALTTHEHVLTRSVRDTAAVLDAVAGAAPGDPYTAPPPVRPFVTEVGADPGRLRIGFRTRLRRRDADAHPECVAAVRATARLLEDLGHHVEEVALDALDDPAHDDAIAGTFAVFVARDVDRWSARLGRTIAPDELEPWNREMAEAGRRVTAATYVAALERANDYSRGLAAWWAGGADERPRRAHFDVLVTPQLGTLPPRLGVIGPEADPATAGEVLGPLTSFTMPFNLTGQPAVSLPLHWSADGLPVGVQFVGGYGREDVLLRLAGQVEAARPWADRHPPAP